MRQVFILFIPFILTFFIGSWKNMENANMQLSWNKEQRFILEKIKYGLAHKNPPEPITNKDLDRLKWRADDYKKLPTTEWNEWSMKIHWALQVAFLHDKNKINEWRKICMSIVQTGISKPSSKPLVLDSAVFHFVQQDLLHYVIETFGHNSLTQLEQQVVSRDTAIPISPAEIMKRIKEIPQVLEWSKSKHLTISSHSWFGTHHIFIDDELNHVLFLLKVDKTSYVYVGNPASARECRKYDSNFRMLFTKRLNEGSLEWKIYKDLVLYKGEILPPKLPADEPYWGEVKAVETVRFKISNLWIISILKQLYQIQRNSDY